MAGLLRSVWDARGYPPSWLAERTPHEIAFLFGPRPPPTPSLTTDPLGHLRRVNQERAAKGLKPIVPRWLFGGGKKKESSGAGRKRPRA